MERVLNRLPWESKPCRTSRLPPRRRLGAFASVNAVKDLPAHFSMVESLGRLCHTHRMSTATEIATSQFLRGYNCAQSVLYAFRSEAGLSEDLALKIATGLGGGMGRKQEVCGAVTGGILVLGLRHGRGSTGDRSATEQTYRKTRELIDQFAARHGSCLCRELLPGYDLATEEGLRRAKADDVLNKVCRPCVQTVVEILEQEP